MDSQTLVTIVIVIAVIIIIIAVVQSNNAPLELFDNLGYIPAPYNRNNFNPQQYELNNPGLDIFNNSMCSKSCCSRQWPTPFPQEYDPEICPYKNNFIPNQYTCMGPQGVGCLCLDRQDATYLYNRGNNA